MARLAVARSDIHVRSKGPRPKGGVDPEAALAVVGSRAVGCADHARASGRDAPPYALLHFGADFSILCRKHRFAKALLAFRWPICRFFSGPSVGHVAHVPLDLLSLLGGGGPLGEALASRVAHTSRRRFWRRQGGPRGLSAQYNGGAGSAPRPAGSTRACTCTA